MANIVAQKTRDIGIRMALGSTIRQAMIHVGAPGVRASVVGLTLGLILSAGVLRAMQSVLYGIGVYDAPTIVAVVLTLALVTLIATTVPTLRIAGIDPAKTLRDESEEDVTVVSCGDGGEAEHRHRSVRDAWESEGRPESYW